MGEERWQYGMQKYLSENSFSSTDGEIWFRYMQRAIDEMESIEPEWILLGAGFNETFDAWFRQMGHPIVTATNQNGKLRLSQRRFLHKGDESFLEKPESNLEYKWNVPIFYVNALNEYKMQWLTTSESLELDGVIGEDIWLDPEANAFIRLHFGSVEQHFEAVTNMINRATTDWAELPDNIHLSIAKVIDDTWEISTAQIDYGVDILQVMDCTRFLSEYSISGMAKQWPIWSAARYAFERSTATSDGVEGYTRDQSTHRLMLFSENGPLYSNYMGSLIKDEAMEQYWLDYDRFDLKHEELMMISHMFEWHCQFDNAVCLNYAYKAFSDVKNEIYNKDAINVNYR